MQQLDFLTDSSVDYVYQELQKTNNSMDRRCRAIFSLLKELQDKIIRLEEEKNASV